jgi:Tfp pilus assembly protein FimT
MIDQTRVTNKPCAGFTLGEVMITLCLTALMCVAAFTGLGTISRLTMAVAIRSEADRLMQAESERLTSVDFNSFVASSSDQTITGSLKTSFLSGNQAQFAYPATGSSGRVTFTRRAVEVASTSTTRTLRVEVQWTWQDRPSLISTVLLRSQ